MSGPRTGWPGEGGSTAQLALYAERRWKRRITCLPLAAIRDVFGVRWPLGRVNQTSTRMNDPRARRRSIGGRTSRHPQPPPARASAALRLSSPRKFGRRGTTGFSIATNPRSRPSWRKLRMRHQFGSLQGRRA